MTRYMLDTNGVSDLFKRHPNVTRRVVAAPGLGVPGVQLFRFPCHHSLVIFPKSVESAKSADIPEISGNLRSVVEPIFRIKVR